MGVFRGLLCAVLVGGACFAPQGFLQAQAEELGKGYTFSGNGKRDFACFEPVYRPDTTLDPAAVIHYDAPTFRKALQQQLPQVPQSQWAKKLPAKLTVADLKHLTPQLIKGEDGCGNTHFTAYFSPIIQLKHKPEGEYVYPLYALPPGLKDTLYLGQPLTRARIDQDQVLAGKGLELGYSKSLLENFFLQVQGSGLAEYVDTGERLTLQYAGQNGLKYSSVGRYLVTGGYIPAEEISLQAIRDFFAQHPDKLVPFLGQNESYVFFKKAQHGPRGSLHTEVQPEVSIAVDPAFIPLGSVVLAEVPQLSAQGEFMGHQLRLLLAQDTGGAIKGPGHVDVYMGAGDAAQQKASALHHYGRLWVLKTK